MRKRLKSRLSLQIFSVTTLALVLLFGVMYLLSVPFIQDTVETIEEHSARTVLDNVYNIVANIHHSLENQRQAMLAERKAQLHDIISVVESHASWLERQTHEGKLTQDQAQAILLDTIRQIHYGHNDYVWAANYRSWTLAHPDSQINDTDSSTIRDARGNLIVPPMVASALASGEGYYSYWFRRLGGNHPLEKLTFYKNLPAFKMIIGSGVYLDDIDAALNDLRNTAIEELRRWLRTIHIGKTGYLYIFDGQNRMLIHPNNNLENKSFAESIDPVTGKNLMPLLIAIADQPEGLSYTWDSPSDPGHYIHNKISWVRYFKGFDWYIGSSVYLDELAESAGILRNRVLMVFAIALLLAIALVYLFVKKLIGPLKQLSATALSIERGNLHARCHLHRDDEIGVVAIAFNTMVSRLQDNIQNLDAKVSARTAELEKANAELKQLDQLKSDFISTVSHELRTPMTSIVGFSKLIKKRLNAVILPQVSVNEKAMQVVSQVRTNLDIIVSESERLTLLLNDVLDIAKLDAGKVDWQKVALAPVYLIERAIAVTKSLAEQKSLALFATGASDLPSIMGDENHLLQVLINLISNAIKFTGQGQIVLGAERQSDVAAHSPSQREGVRGREDIEKPESPLPTSPRWGEESERLQ